MGFSIEQNDNEKQKKNEINLVQLISNILISTCQKSAAKSKRWAQSVDSQVIGYLIMSPKATRRKL